MKIGQRATGGEGLPLWTPSIANPPCLGIWLILVLWIRVSAPSRDEALTNMCNELQYQLKLSLCSGVSGDTVVLQVLEDSRPAR